MKRNKVICCLPGWLWPGTAGSKLELELELRCQMLRSPAEALIKILCIFHLTFLPLLKAEEW